MICNPIKRKEFFRAGALTPMHRHPDSGAAQAAKFREMRGQPRGMPTTGKSGTTVLASAAAAGIVAMDSGDVGANSLLQTQARKPHIFGLTRRLYVFSAKALEDDI